MKKPKIPRDGILHKTKDYVKGLWKKKKKGK